MTYDIKKILINLHVFDILIFTISMLSFKTFYYWDFELYYILSIIGTVIDKNFYSMWNRSVDAAGSKNGYTLCRMGRYWEWKESYIFYLYFYILFWCLHADSWYIYCILITLNILIFFWWQMIFFFKILINVHVFDNLIFTISMLSFKTFYYFLNSSNTWTGFWVVLHITNNRDRNR